MKLNILDKPETSLKKTISALLVLLAFCMIKCDERGKSYANSDLSFFNLLGNVKKFSDITVLGALSDSANFETIATREAGPYYEYCFSKEGELEKVEIINPAFYSPGDTEIKISRDSNTLTVTDNSLKAKSIITYCKKDDTLNFTQWVKIEDNEINYHLERYKQYVYLKDGKNYIQNAYFEGKNRNQITKKQYYTVVKNQHGFDSLIYLKQTDRDSALIYSVKYLEFDKKGNWLVGQFKNNLDWGNTNSYTIYRHIEYYK